MAARSDQTRPNIDRSAAQNRPTPASCLFRRLLEQARRPAIIIDLEEGFTFRIGTVVNRGSLESLLQLGMCQKTHMASTAAGVAT